MATQWVLDRVSGALAPTVSGVVSSAGTFAGGAVNAVGNAINGVGDGINNSIRRYGDGTKDYGNAIMDWTKADGIRESTASNPLGLSGGAMAGKRQVTTPRVYQAPPSQKSQTLMTMNKSVPASKRVEPATPKKALPSQKPRAATAAPSKPAATGPKPLASSNPGAMRKPTAAQTGAVQKPTAGNNRPPAVQAKRATPTPTAPKTKTRTPAKYQASSAAAANPLGLT